MMGLTLALHVTAGLAIGGLYFGSLWWSTHRFALGGPAGALLGGIALRFAVLGGTLWVASRAGALPLLATALGVLVARFAVMRRVRSLAS